MENNFKEFQQPEYENSEIAKNTERLFMISRQLEEGNTGFYHWKSMLGQLLEKGVIGFKSHDPRNYHQTFYLNGMTELGENPIIGEFEYGDDFHKANGEPKLIGYSTYRYDSNKAKNIIKYSSQADGAMSITYNEEVNKDGSRSVKEEVGGKWQNREYDADGNIIEK